MCLLRTSPPPPPLVLSEFAARFYDLTMAGHGADLRANEELAQRAPRVNLLDALVKHIRASGVKDANPMNLLCELVYGEAEGVCRAHLHLLPLPFPAIRSTSTPSAAHSPTLHPCPSSLLHWRALHPPPFYSGMHSGERLRVGLPGKWQPNRCPPPHTHTQPPVYVCLCVAVCVCVCWADETAASAASAAPASGASVTVQSPLAALASSSSTDDLASIFDSGRLLASTDMCLVAGRGFVLEGGTDLRSVDRDAATVAPRCGSRLLFPAPLQCRSAFAVIVVVVFFKVLALHLHGSSHVRCLVVCVVCLPGVRQGSGHVIGLLVLHRHGVGPRPGRGGRGASGLGCRCGPPV